MTAREEAIIRDLQARLALAEEQLAHLKRANKILGTKRRKTLDEARGWHARYLRVTGRLP